jgi:hypothetical protein
MDPTKKKQHDEIVQKNEVLDAMFVIVLFGSDFVGEMWALFCAVGGWVELGWRLVILRDARSSRWSGSKLCS